MKTLTCITLAAALLVGCGTTSNRPHQALPISAGRTHVYQASFTNVWRAALNAGNRPPLVIRTHEIDRGYIGAETPTRWESWGERVSIWIAPTNDGTAVTVASKPVGPTFAFRFDWTQPTLASIAAELGEPIPPEPTNHIVRATSPRGR